MTASSTGISADRAHEPIPILRYSTEDLPPEERYRAWLLRDWPRTDPIYRTEPTEPFNTSWESAQLGPVLFAYVEITGQRWERRLQDIRASDFDPVIINLMIEGLAQGDMDGRPFHEPAGTFHFHDLARPSLHVSSASRTYSIIVPRALAMERFAPLGDIHGLVVEGEGAAMLFSHAAQVHRALSRVDTSLAERLGNSLLDIAAIALAEALPAAAEPASSETRLRRRAEDEIERRLGSGDLGVTELCRALGVPRARLFAAFKSDGGVHNHVIRVRLERARAALADIDRAEPIGTIADRLGFSDASHLSRTFRGRYGMTPREYRQLLTTDRDALSRD
jgi:AraC-like DNA-binding protein